MDSGQRETHNCRLLRINRAQVLPPYEISRDVRMQPEYRQRLESISWCFQHVIKKYQRLWRRNPFGSAVARSSLSSSQTEDTHNGSSIDDL